MIEDYFRLAWGSLRKRKLRSWLTILGIFIGITAMVAIVSLGQGFQKAVEDQFANIGGDKLIILPKGQFGPPGSTSVAAELKKSDVDAARRVSGVDDATYFVAGNAKIVFNDNTRFYMVGGVPLDNSFKIWEEIYKIAEGRTLKSGDKKKILIGSYFQTSNVFGKEVKIRDKLLINGEEFSVVGILKTIGNPSDDSIIIMPKSDFDELFNPGERIDEIVVKVANKDSVAQVSENVKSSIRRERNEKAGKETFSILTAEEVLKAFQSIFQVVQVFIAGIAAISLLVGGIGIMNTMYTAVLERTREIGVMKAIGARNKDVLLIFLIESGLLGLVGGLIGIAIGIGLAKGVEYGVSTAFSTNLLQAYFPWYLIVGAGLFSFIAGMASGVLPAIQASRLRPVEALRYE